MRIQDVHRTWETADGHVVMMIIEDSQFEIFVAAPSRIVTLLKKRS